MKYYELRDKAQDNRILGYFILNPKTNDCNIELVRDIDEWDLPFVLDSFAKRGEWSVGYNSTLDYISQRIIPSDRQNISDVLLDNGLDEYDEINLFLISEGRCAQDECYIRRVTRNALPDDIVMRLSHRFVGVEALSDKDYLIAFSDGTIAELNLQECKMINNAQQKRIMAYAMRGEMLISGGGSYISLAQTDLISSEMAYVNGMRLPLKLDTLQHLTLKSIMTTQDVMEEYGCTRQNVNDLVKRGKLTPLEVNSKSMVFSRAEVMLR